MTRPMRTTLLALLATAVVLAAVNLWVWQRADSESDRATIEERTASATAAGVEAVVTALSYRHDAVQEYVAAVDRVSAGTFKEEFAELVPSLTERAARGRLVLAAEVSAVGAIDSSADTVDLLLFVNQSTQRRQAPPEIRGVRLRVRMEAEGDAWLMTQMSPV